MFIYIGGEIEKWVDKILGTDVITSKTELIKVTDCVETIEEQEVDGAEEEEEHEHHSEEGENEHEYQESAFDEHIWTSPTNAKRMVKYLNEKIADLDKTNKVENELKINYNKVVINYNLKGYIR